MHNPEPGHDAALRILIVTEKSVSARPLAKVIRRAGYDVNLLAIGRHRAWDPRMPKPDLIVLGPMTRKSRLMWLTLRKHDSVREIPVIKITARLRRSTETFNMDAILDRIRRFETQLHHLTHPAISPLEGPPLLIHRGVVIDRLRHRAYSQGREICLSTTEFRLLECFLREPERAFTFADLKKMAGVSSGRRGLKHHVQMVRQKVAVDGVIVSVHAYGYRFCD